MTRSSYSQKVEDQFCEPKEWFQKLDDKLSRRKKPMRVLAICYEDPADILGGMGRHVRELYRTLAARGVQVDLLTQGRPEGSEEYLGFTRHFDDKLVCAKPTKPDFACHLLADIQMAKTLTRLIAEKGARHWDVIHQHEWTSVQLARMARDALNIPVVGTMHLCISRLAMLEDPTTNPADWGEADRYMFQQEGNLICDPDELILCSQAYVDMARSHFMAKRQINMIPNGIDLEKWNPAAGDGGRARFDHGLDFASGVPMTPRPMALYVGRIALMKGIEYLLDALEACDPGWQVVLAGEVNANDEESKEDWVVTKRIRALEKAHPERLRWVGFQRGQALRDLYAGAGCVVMPSTHEPFGIVALEAMAMGAPLIATEVDGLGEIVMDDHQEYAMIIPSRNPDAILAALRELHRSEIREELRYLGMRRARNYSWEAVADATTEVYGRAVGNRHRSLCSV